MPTPAEFGRKGGAPSKFERGRTGTDMDVAAGKQRTLTSSWGGVILSSVKNSKVSTSSSNQNSGPTEFRRLEMRKDWSIWRGHGMLIVGRGLF